MVAIIGDPTLSALNMRFFSIILSVALLKFSAITSSERLLRIFSASLALFTGLSIHV
jgi:hypothetical protein